LKGDSSKKKNLGRKKVNEVIEGFDFGIGVVVI
jgi:hypothetical protein